MEVGPKAHPRVPELDLRVRNFFLWLQKTRKVFDRVLGNRELRATDKPCQLQPNGVIAVDGYVTHRRFVNL